MAVKEITKFCLARMFRVDCFEDIDTAIKMYLGHNEGICKCIDAHAFSGQEYPRAIAFSTRHPSAGEFAPHHGIKTVLTVRFNFGLSDLNYLAHQLSDSEAVDAEHY